MIHQITLPLKLEVAQSLRAGDEVEISGSILTGRDQACARLFQELQANRPASVDLRGQLLYFVGPTPPSPGNVIGSAGPTTSERMNPFLPALIQHGLRGFIGKGYIGRDVKAALQVHQSVYFGAIGGTGALLSSTIVAAEVIAFPELLSEAIRHLKLRHLPAVVLHDACGGDLYESAAARKDPHP